MARRNSRVKRARRGNYNYYRSIETALTASPGGRAVFKSQKEKTPAVERRRGEHLVFA